MEFEKADFTEGLIDGVIEKVPAVNRDSRGWLVEFFRADDLQINLKREMAYISGTNPLVVRGPHMHREQTDYFCFLGIGSFSLYLWDNRPESKTYRVRQIIDIESPRIVVVPPMVVHAYKNTSWSEIGVVMNIPDKLYAGVNKSEPVDEVRFESDPSSPFRI